MHPLLRVLGWTLLVALLVGLFWPERSEPVAGSPLAAHARDPAPAPVPPCTPDAGCVKLAGLIPMPPGAGDPAGSP